MSEVQSINESPDYGKDVVAFPLDAGMLPVKKDQQNIITIKETQHMETHAHELYKAPGHRWKH